LKRKKTILKLISGIILISFMPGLKSCISEFVPPAIDNKKLLVVDGVITNQPDTNTIRLSRSSPVGKRNVPNPLKGCIVTITDDSGGSYSLRETTPGTYVTDPSKFQGIIGHFYTLHINTNLSKNNHVYQSDPTELKSVPPIDSLYYEKKTLQMLNDGTPSQEACQIYLDTYDPGNNCKFFRWEYKETWEFILPYSVQNSTCWISSNSDNISIKRTTAFEENRIKHYPVTYISNLTDRLRVKYSILVKQYSLNENEYRYWETLQNMAELVGGLYDIIPSGVISNVYCLDDPDNKVLGYFSVSSCSTRRLFINDFFGGILTPYTNEECIADTIYGDDPIPFLNMSAWIIIEHPVPPPAYNVITYKKGCADCAARGTTREPDFWKENNRQNKNRSGLKQTKSAD
jgi:hypothetical protein